MNASDWRETTLPPTAEEIARVHSWEAAEQRKKDDEDKANRLKHRIKNRERIEGYFEGKRIVRAEAGETEPFYLSDEVWGLHLFFDDDSSIAIRSYSEEVTLDLYFTEDA